MRRPHTILSRVSDLVARAPASPTELYLAGLSDAELVNAIHDARACRDLVAAASAQPTPDARLVAELERLPDHELRRLCDHVLDSLLAARRTPDVTT